MIRKGIIVIMLMVASFLVSGCEKVEDWLFGDGDENEIVRVNPEYVPIDWDNATLLSSDDSTGNYQIQFDGEVPDIHPGSILAIDQDTVVNYLFVETMSVNGNMISVTATEASLTDIFHDSKFTLSTESAGKSKAEGLVFYPEEAYLKYGNGGYEVLHIAGGRKDDTWFTHNLWHYGFNHNGYVIHSGSAHSILMDKMNMDLDLDMEMYMNFGGRNIYETVADGINRYRSEATKVNAALIGKFSTEQQIRCKVWSSCHISTPSFTIKSSVLPSIAIRFMVGPVPIILKLQCDLCGQAELNASGEIQAYTGFSDQSVGRMGFEWSQTGGMSPVSSFENTFAFTPPTIEGKGQIQSKLWVFPKISVMLYGIVGPSFDFMPYDQQIIQGGFREQLLGQTNDYCAWSYDNHVGLDLSCGLNFNFFKRNILNDVISKSLPPWNVIDFLQYHSPTRVAHASGRPQGGQTSTVYFDVYDHEYMFDRDVKTPLWQIVKFETSGELSSEYGIAHDGTVSVEWTPNGSDTLWAKLYDIDGNVLAWDTVMVACDYCNVVDNVYWVDLGLPSGRLWASRNIGASSPADYGNYYSWGEISPKSNYSLSDYRYYLYEHGNSGYTKYCSNPDDGYNGFTDNLTILLNGDDAACGYGGHTPTPEDWQELFNNTTLRYRSIGGVNGICCTGTNCNSIFLPFGSYKSSSGLDHRLLGIEGLYWSNEKNDSSTSHARFFSLNYSSEYDYCWGSMSSVCRNWGMTVRAVR